MTRRHTVLLGLGVALALKTIILVKSFTGLRDNRYRKTVLAPPIIFHKKYSNVWFANGLHCTTPRQSF